MKKVLTILCLALLLTLVCASALAITAVDSKYLHNGTTIQSIITAGTINGKLIDTTRDAVIITAPNCITGRIDIPVVPAAAGRYESLSIDPIHDWKLQTKDGKAATCETGGVGQYVCSKCGTVKPGDVEIPRREHDKTKKVIDKAETCSQKGKYHFECTYCGDPEKNADGTIKYYEIAIHAFKEGPIKVDKVQTCKEGGIRYYTCALCGEPKWKTLGTEIDVDPLYKLPGAHDWGDWIVITPATCVDGSQARYCSFCNASETKVIPGDGNHDWNYQIVPNGKCAADTTDDPTYATTDCFSVAKKICKVCGKEEDLDNTYFTNQKYISHHAYTVKTDGPSEPAGCIGGADGYRTLVCSKCGDTYKQVLPKATQHVWGSWINIKLPTTTTDGVWERYCTNYLCTAKESYVGKTAPKGADPKPVTTPTNAPTTAPTGAPSGSENYQVTSWSFNGSGVSGQVKGNVTYRTPGLSVNVIIYTPNGTFLATSTPVNDDGSFSVSAGGAVYAVSIQLKDNNKTYQTDGKYV